MFRAKQQQLFQETNVELVQLRHMEITYHFTVNSAIGTQAALIGGFVYGLFTQNIPSDYVYTKPFLSAYYITSTITIFASIHIVMNTMLIQIFGPGLALHGPAGSMVKAAETMRDEQQQIVTSFFVMMTFFALATLLCFWAVMDYTSASISSFLFFVAARQWVFYSNRVYRRLYFDSSRIDTIFADVLNADPVEPVIASKPVLRRNEDVETHRQSVVLDESRRSSAVNVMYNALFRNKKTGNQSGEAKEEGVEIRTSETFSKVHEAKDIAMEGYLQKKGSSRDIGKKWSSWERRYYILNFAGILAPYASRQEYSSGSASSLRERPLDIEDFNVFLDGNLADIEESEKSSVTPSQLTTESVSTRAKDQFRIIFVSKDKEDGRKIVFRCDSEEDFQLWMEALSYLIPDNIITEGPVDN